MDTSDTAAVIVAVASGMAVLVIVYAIVQLTRTLTALRESLEEMRRETLPVVVELRSAVGQATADLERADTLLVNVESISTTLDSASRLAYLAFSNPIIKTLAFASGTGRAVRRFRRRRLHE
jgi:hypothetical protein